MGAAARNIEHIGSTAIVGMPSKPIIDLVVVVNTLAEAGAWIPTHKYFTLKEDLAAHHPNDREAYTSGKRDFVERILRLASNTPL